jgi:hypothetical protein
MSINIYLAVKSVLKKKPDFCPKLLFLSKKKAKKREKSEKKILKGPRKHFFGHMTMFKVFKRCLHSFPLSWKTKNQKSITDLKKILRKFTTHPKKQDLGGGQQPNCKDNSIWRGLIAKNYQNQRLSPKKNG